MTTPPSVSTYQVVISSNDSITGNDGNNFTVSVAGHLPMDTCEFYVRLIASEVEVSPDVADTHLKNILTIHADIGQQSILATNPRVSSNFLGLHHTTNNEYNTIEHNPFLRCSKPKLGQVNIQIRDAFNGALAVPVSEDGNTFGGIRKVVLVLEFIPIEYMRIAREGQTYKSYGIL